MATKTKEKISIPAKASVRVVWEGDPVEYTKDRVKRVEQYISQKYSVDKVQVIFKPKKQDTEHEIRYLYVLFCFFALKLCAIKHTNINNNIVHIIL